MYSKEIKKSLIKQWFYRIYHGQENDCILLLLYTNDVTSNFQQELKSTLKKLGYGNTRFTIASQLHVLNNKNLILIFDPNKPNNLYGKVFLNQNYLPILYTDGFYQEIEQYLEDSVNFTDSIPINNKLRYLYYWEHLDPLTLIKNYSKKEIYDFLFYSISTYLHHFRNNSYQKELVYDISYPEVPIMNNEPLKFDLTLLESKDILSSRLAVLIYRVATRNTLASTTEAGRYFHKEIGSKSKTLNLYKQNKQQTHDDNGKLIRNKHNFKGYDLSSMTPLELAIRTEIAENLIHLLDNDDIAYVTKLSLEEVEKIRNSQSRISIKDMEARMAQTLL